MIPFFRCPNCGSQCQPQSATITCPDCGYSASPSDGIYDILTADSLRHHQGFLDHYHHIRRSEKRGSEQVAWYLGLPTVPEDHPFRKEWEQRRESMEWLQKFLAENFPNRNLDVLDAGAGNCWLTRHLAQWGHRAVALDIDNDPRDGLAAGSHFLQSLPINFQRVRGDFAQLPFVAGAFDLVVFNGAFHYALEQGQLLDEALRVARPGGAVVVIDSPVYTTAEDGEKMMSERAEQGRARYLTIMGLNDLANARGLKLQVFTPSIGFFGWLRRQATEIRRGREIAMMDRIVFSKPEME